LKTNHKYLGLDVHEETIVICVAEGGREGSVRSYGSISNDLHALERTLTKLASDGSTLHLCYLRGLRLTLPHQQMLLEELLLSIQEAQARLARIEQLIEAEAPAWRLYPVVKALMCLRGFKLTAATMTVAELGDIRRFEHPRQLMAFLGLIPQENTTGESRHLGSITKNGNTHARWILCEAAQHAGLPPNVSVDLTTRQSGQPEDYIKIGWKAQGRLYKRYQHLLHRGVMLGKIKIAVTRELSGFVWDVMRAAFERLDQAGKA